MRYFDPTDYPDYTFCPETGTPIRVTAPKRGPFAGQTNRPVPELKSKPGSFAIRRADGPPRTISRETILSVINPPARPANTWDHLPKGSLIIPGFEDYAYHPGMAKVFRFHNPNTGIIDPPIELKESRYTVKPKPTITRDSDAPGLYTYYYFSLEDYESGERKRVPRSRIWKLVGLNPVLAVRTAHQYAAARVREAAETGIGNRETIYSTPAGENAICQPE